MDQPAPAPPLRDGALVNADQDLLTADVVIIGSGMGGGTLAWALKDTGLDVLIVERGQFLPREPENSQPDHVFIKKRYVTSKPWYDAKTGRPFQPGVYYWVGGNTKMYGACLPRFRRSDLEETTHHDGISPAWPFRYDDLEPFYAKAEELFEVHGAVGRTRPNPSTRRPTRTRRSATNPPSNGSPSGCTSRDCTRSTWPVACTCRRWSNGAPTPPPTARPPPPGRRATPRTAPSGRPWSH